jgi:hypothetical protein
MSMVYPTYRVLAKHIVFKMFLCSSFRSVHVDSAALLKAVESEHLDLRALNAIGKSPMRSRQGCSGCHAPMDNAAAMLTGIATPLFGGYETGADTSGQLFVNGANDDRGTGKGLRADYAIACALIV